MRFVAKWMELDGVLPSEIRQRKTDTICFHSYLDAEKLRPGERGKGEKIYREGRSLTVSES